MSQVKFFSCYYQGSLDRLRVCYVDQPKTGNGVLTYTPDGWRHFKFDKMENFSPLTKKQWENLGGVYPPKKD